MTLQTTPLPGPTASRRPVGLPSLVVVAGAAMGRVHVLADRTQVLGRSPGTADVVLPDRGVSRRHARVLRAGDDVVNIVDLESTNGTFVNGVRIDLALLREGDRIRLGPDAELRLSYVASMPTVRSGRYLTPRQLEIARLVARGLTNPQIARRLTVSVRTVTSHLDHIYVRLDLGSRAELARWLTETELGGNEAPR